MREIRTSGSEGGGPQANAVFLPLLFRMPCHMPLQACIFI
jgi:hypothetical protein